TLGLIDPAVAAFDPPLEEGLLLWRSAQPLSDGREQQARVAACQIRGVDRAHTRLELQSSHRRPPACKPPSRPPRQALGAEMPRTSAWRHLARTRAAPRPGKDAVNTDIIIGTLTV